jgi:nitroreductase/NAD-dependent dihydropyrimidine dehydrogenase PreA subunit
LEIFTVNEQTCNQCGACAAVCNLQIIDFQKNASPKPHPLADKMCNKCTACMAVCPTKSIVVRDISYDQCPSLDPSIQISLEQCAQFIKSRRAVRSFKDKAVPRELIEKAIDVARYSPSGNNMQNVRWLVFDGKDQVEHLVEAGYGYILQLMSNSPLGSTLTDFTKEKKMAGIDMFLRGAPVVVSTYARKNDPVSAVSCSVALAYFDLAAMSLGLGGFWAGMFYYAANRYAPVKEIVALPDEYEIYGSLAVGFPKYKYLRLPMRNQAHITWR